MLNRITIMGRLAKDPELRRTKSNIPVAGFTVAVERDVKNDAGERDCDFIDCTAWRGTAEIVDKYFDKGQMIAVTGRLQSQDWTDKDGGKRRSWTVVADSVYFCESKKSSAASGGAAAAAPEQKTEGQKYIEAIVYGDAEEDDGELLF
ncbi:MAG: single-stranded DNA-binding protein [Oscillospiraceae bacterium]|nr:single-stranded DNA-binding protein [Oscillospiraceae bacterium]